MKMTMAIQVKVKVKVKMNMKMKLETNMSSQRRFFDVAAGLRSLGSCRWSPLIIFSTVLWELPKNHLESGRAVPLGGLWAYE